MITGLTGKIIIFGLVIVVVVVKVLLTDFGLIFSGRADVTGITLPFIGLYTLGIATFFGGAIKCGLITGGGITITGGVGSGFSEPGGAGMVAAGDGEVADIVDAGAADVVDVVVVVVVAGVGDVADIADAGAAEVVDVVVEVVGGVGESADMVDAG